MASAGASVKRFFRRVLIAGVVLAVVVLAAAVTATVLPADGSAVAPKDAPQIVRDVINTGNVIAKTPYLWGGGHGSWAASGYDCSGSVSFALAGAGLLDSPLTSGLLARWGSPGRGRWITIYANGGHV